MTRGLALVGLTALLSLAPVTLLVLDPVMRPLPRLAAPVASALGRYSVLAIALALLGSVAALSAQSAAVAPGLAQPAAIGQTLAETRYGQFWPWRFALLAIGAALIVVPIWGRANWRRPSLPHLPWWASSA